MSEDPNRERREIVPPKMVKKEYRIVILQAGPDESVTLGLVPIFTLRSISDEADRTPNPGRVIVGPAIQSEDAKVAREMISAVMDEVSKKMQQYGPPPSASFTPQGLIPLNLTKEEYAQLGKPTAHEIITLTLELEKIDQFTCTKCGTVTKLTDYDFKDGNLYYALKKQGECEKCTKGEGEPHV